MDSTRIDSVNPAEDPSLEIQDKKDQLRAVARSVDPLSSLRKHPYVTISVAAALGVMAGAPEVAGSAQKAVSGGILKMFTGVAMQFARAGPRLTPHKPAAMPPRRINRRRNPQPRKTPCLLRARK